MKTEFALVISSLFLIAFASATIIGCEPQNYNMGSLTIQLNEPLPKYLNSQNIISSDCCDEPIFNNYFIPSKQPLRLNYVESQNIIANDCCGSPSYNNHILSEEFRIFPKALETYHLVPCCGN